MSAYGREPLLAFVREHAPDLRIGRSVDEEGLRWSHALFTLYGEQHELQVSGDDADERIAMACADRVRACMGLGPLEPVFNETRVGLEQAIIRASLAGNAEQEAALTHELLFGPAPQQASLIGTRTNISGSQDQFGTKKQEPQRKTHHR